ncbi:hypothetical protein BDP27DRAFT_1427900 [Rhodocollybia butyracea]|uniref:Uncharacterized protein n=1 Tax=Rhodocollybia butyracea TaxID=206335 RepID=A0A9P5U0B2_9AGAR|nr:hypothetical protein BDP27DRAFT_1427900 [Rhodocollybia butyracea]
MGVGSNSLSSSANNFYKFLHKHINDNIINMGSIVSSIGGAIEAIISAIAGLIMAIVSGITMELCLSKANNLDKFLRLEDLTFAPPSDWGKPDDRFQEELRSYVPVFYDFLRLFPNISKLECKKSIPLSFSQIPIPPDIVPRLTSLIARQELASAFIPGRPIQKLKLLDRTSEGELLKSLLVDTSSRLRIFQSFRASPLNQCIQILNLLSELAPDLEELKLGVTDTGEEDLPERSGHSAFRTYSLEIYDPIKSFGDLVYSIIQQYPLVSLPSNLVTLHLTVRVQLEENF